MIRGVRAVFSRKWTGVAQRVRQEPGGSVTDPAYQAGKGVAALGGGHGGVELRRDRHTNVCELSHLGDSC